MALTHRELCQIAYKFLKRNGFKVCFHDRFIAVTSTGEQPDAMGFRNSASCLIEAKCSRADLLADRKKRFRKNPSLGMGDWRFFISEPGIISVEDLPPGWGSGGFTIEEAKELHENLVKSHVSKALSGEKMKKENRDADLRWIHGVIVQAAWFVKASLGQNA